MPLSEAIRYSGIYFSESVVLDRHCGTVQGTVCACIGQLIILVLHKLGQNRTAFVQMIVTVSDDGIGQKREAEICVQMNGTERRRLCVQINRISICRNGLHHSGQQRASEAFELKQIIKK